MRTQYLGRGDDWTIETPLGPIRLIHLGRGKCQAVMPDSLRAWKGKKKAAEHAAFGKWDDEGNFTPSYTLLAPVMDKNGHLLRLEPPQVLHIGEAQ
jgi:hypothetical protein